MREPVEEVRDELSRLAREAAANHQASGIGIPLHAILEGFAARIAGDLYQGIPTELFRFNEAKALQSAALAHEELGRPTDRHAVWNALFLAEASHYEYGRPIFAEAWIATPIGVMPRNLSALTDGIDLDAALDREIFSKSDIRAILRACSVPVGTARTLVMATRPRAGIAPGRRLDMLAEHLPASDPSNAEARLDILHMSRHCMM